jgi:hypothetical protein
MKKIYEGRHRGDWGWLFLSAGALFVGACMYTVISSFLSWVTMIGLGIVVLGGTAIAHELRLRRRSPLDVRILDGSRLRVTARQGTYTYNADQLTAITCIFDPYNGRLFLNANGPIWYMPCNKDEANNVIAAFVSLNPLIRVELRDDGGL